MDRWARFFYQPGINEGRDGQRITASSSHTQLSRRAASEGMVLLKNNDGLLPLRRGTRAALFGKASADYVKGGGGSGDVTVAYVHNLIYGMECKEREGKIALFSELNRFYEANVQHQYAQGVLPGMTKEPALPEELLTKAAAWADTAIISICRFSGENWDRTVEGYDNAQTEKTLQVGEEEFLRRSRELFRRGDFYLSDEEEALIARVKEKFDRIVIVLNVGGAVDTAWMKEDPRIGSVLLAWQGGMEGGLAEADILCGDVNPSGKLADTLAASLEDYPSTAAFHESEAYVSYTEDIYVGYRYFATLPGKNARVTYPFGFGLSYTTFAQSCRSTEFDGESYRIWCDVTNTGRMAGREVVQLYGHAPGIRLDRPSRELKAFAKTRCLLPGETQSIVLEIRLEDLAAFDDLGVICKSAWVLEKGEYEFYLGTNVENARMLEQGITLGEDRIVARLTPRCVPKKLKERLKADGSMEKLEIGDQPEATPWEGPKEAGITMPDVAAVKGKRLFPPEEDGSIMLRDVAEGRHSLDELMDQLTLEEKVHLLCGQPNTGVAQTFGFGNLPAHGVPNVMTTDGPAGVRIAPGVGVVTTAFPCATLLACSWDPELAEQIGAAGGMEVRENNMGVWLTPAMNIHRSPLCGRNFEYYSEDPLLSGKIGAGMVRGIQSCQIAASVKHFACNNKETNRFESDSRLSERALREIYLKGFEIVVREADPWTIMSSYNIINGVRSSENKDLLTGILREEWGFGGIVTTDWWNHASQPKEIRAGNDVKMGCGYPQKVLQAIADNELTEEEVTVCARRMLELILKLG